MNDVYEYILDIVWKRERLAGPGRGVMPQTVACFLPFYRCEQSLRRDMAKLAKAGVLKRVGSPGSRRGYRITSAA